MILSGSDIRYCVQLGRIEIDPFDPARVNPASYDLTLGDRALRYKVDDVIDAKMSQETIEVSIGPEGIVLMPGRLLLCHTVERIKTDHYVPIVDGKSSLGRYGVGIHVTAGFGDPGFDGQYTLELFSVEHAIRLYPGMRIAQIRFHVLGPHGPYYRGSYTGLAAKGPVASKLWRQFLGEESSQVSKGTSVKE